LNAWRAQEKRGFYSAAVDQGRPVLDFYVIAPSRDRDMGYDMYKAQFANPFFCAFRTRKSISQQIEEVEKLNPGGSRQIIGQMPLNAVQGMHDELLF
jgi:hypothetical protein